ncbi:hypothetical protein D3C81_2033300 [compost metagenome]
MGIRGITAIGIADRIQRETQALFMGGGKVPAILDPARKAPSIGQRLGTIGPIHMPFGKGHGTGAAHRGHGVQQAEELDA